LTLLRNPFLRVALVLGGLAGVVVLLVFRGPNWDAVGSAFTAVKWVWVAIAIGFNLLSVVTRAFAWTQVIDAAIPRPWPRFRSIFSAFSVGLMANALLPGRIGELARVAVLVRRLPKRRGLWATLVGTVFAHRVFDIAPVVLLILYVLITAKIPAWASTSLIVFVAAGVALFAFAFASARLQQRAVDGLGAFRRVVAMARQGLGVMRIGPRAALAILFQILGWLCQLFAVYTAMRAFGIHAPLPAAGLVLVLMNVATIFPLWPGNVGLVQIAIATPLVQYGVDYARGVAYGFGLQAIEASVGVGIGLIFLAREGLSFAMLRVMPGAEQADQASPEEIDEPERAGVSR
jgi:glycosyltransferase 2 family protein